MDSSTDRKPTMRTYFFEQKNRHHLVVACSWDDLLMVLRLVNTAVNCGFGSAAPSMKLRGSSLAAGALRRPLINRKFPGFKSLVSGRFCPTGGPAGHGDPPGLETGGKTPQTIWMCIENIEIPGQTYPPPKKTKVTKLLT